MHENTTKHAPSGSIRATWYIVTIIGTDSSGYSDIMIGKYVVMFSQYRVSKGWGRNNNSKLRA